MRVAFFVLLLNPKEKINQLKCPKNGVHDRVDQHNISFI